MTRRRDRRWREALALTVLISGGCRGEGPAGALSGVEPGAVTEVEASTPPAAPALEAHHLLLITVDTLRWDAVGSYGRRQSVTPNLDRLAEEGWLFERAYAHNVVTLPSHANILTGRLPYQHGIRDNSGFELGADVPTAATVLKEAGFDTAAFVAAYPLDAAFGLDRGFDLYDDDYPKGSERLDQPAERSGDEVVARALEWWRKSAGRRLLWLHLYDPHAPYAPPVPSADPYLGEVAAVDSYLEPLLDAVRATPDSLVVFTADHGEALGDHGERTHGLFAYEATLRVPLILWAEAMEPGRRPDVVSHVDLLPTLLDAAGVETPAGVAGETLLTPADEPRPVYFESLTAALDRGWAPLRGVVLDRHKLIELPLPELYDLQDDPAESVNLIDSQRAVARDLLRRLPEESRWPPPRTSTAGDREALRDLGYLGGAAEPKASYTAADDPKNLVHLDARMHDLIDSFHRGRLAEAERLGREILAERDDMSAAHYYLAQVLLAGERVEDAVAVMSRARAIGVATPALSRQLGLSLTELGRFREAVEVLRPLAVDGDSRTLNAFGIALSEAGAQAEARRQFERALEADPRDPSAHQNLALVALREGRWQAAAGHARRAVDLNDRLSQAWGYLGAANYQTQRKRQALEAWQRAVALDENNYDALYNITIVAAELGELTLLRDALERFVRIAPPSRYAADLEAARARLRELSR